MRVVFRADASPQIGGGHLARCLTVADVLRARGVDTTIATFEAPRAVLERIEAIGHAVVRLPSPLDPDATALVASPDDTLVLDGYHLDASYHDALRGRVGLLATFDDLGDRACTADVLINGNVYATEVAYPADPAAIFLLGPRFAAIRPEFLVAREARARRADGRRRRRRVFVTLGAADPSAATEAVLEGFADAPELELRIAVGAANPRVEAIRERAGQLAARHKVLVLVDVREMGREMLDADVVVTAAGTTCLEIACVGVAAVAVPTVANQRLVAAAVAYQGLMATATSATAASAALDLLEQPEVRHAMEGRQRAAVDGLGAGRIADVLPTRRGGTRRAPTSSPPSKHGAARPHSSRETP